jgi:hypothetical protein
MNLKTNLDIPFNTYTPVLGTDTVAGQIVVDSNGCVLYVVNAANNAYGIAINQSLLTTDSPTFAGLTVGTLVYPSSGNVVTGLVTESGAGITLTASNPTGFGTGYYTPSISGNLVIGGYGVTFTAIADSSTAGKVFLSSTTAYVLKYYDTQGTPVLHQIATLGVSTDTAQTFGSHSTWNGALIGAAYGGTGVNNSYTITVTTGNVALNQNLRTSDSPTFVAITSDIGASSGTNYFKAEGNTAITLEWLRNQTGGSYNIQWNMVIPASSTTFQIQCSTSAKTLLTFYSTGKLTTPNNTLDDGSGAMTIIGLLTSVGAALGSGSLSGTHAQNLGSGDSPTFAALSVNGVISSYDGGTPYTGEVDYTKYTYNASVTFAKVSSNNPVFVVPITLTNTAAGATVANFTQLITINGTTYSTYTGSYLNSNLQNVNFQDGAGNVLSSWLETPSATNTTTSINYWINLGANTIAGSNGTFTVYMCIYATSVNCMNGTTTGAQPNYTGTYGQYDNGTTVFQWYENFASAPSDMTGVAINSASAPSFSNGMNFSYGTAALGYCYYTTASMATSVVELYQSAVTGLLLTCIGMQLGVPTAQNSLSNTLTESYTHAIQSGGNRLDDLFKYHSNSQTTLASQTPSSGAHIITLTWNATGAENTLTDYANPLTSTDNALTKAVVYVTVTGYDDGSGSNTATIQWARARVYPPSNTMPTVGIGSIYKSYNAANLYVFGAVCVQNGLIMTAT